MHRFRRREPPIDPLWGVASATHVLVADPNTVSSLTLKADLEDLDATVEGVLIAARHPTGWFLHAVRRNDLPAAQHALFREFVTVRSYLLLARGPQAPVWRPSAIAGEWRSASFSIADELTLLDDAVAD